MPEEVSLVQHMRAFFNQDWTNGACVLVADKAEFSKIKENLDFPLNTPLELFREEVSYSYSFDACQTDKPGLFIMLNVL